MVKCSIAFFIATIHSYLLFGQEGTLKGKIADAKTQEGLGGVNIYIDGKGVASSDIDGNYQVKCSTGMHSVEYRFIGYSTVVHKVEIKENEAMQLDITLSIEATELGVIVVSAGKFEQKLEEVTVSMNVIKPSLIENKNTTNMEDLMQQCPGVNVLDGQANIRGGSGFSYGAGTRVLVLLDDLPLVASDAGDVKWNFIPVENIEQVEIIKGASSALFGSSALNGVINFRTSYPKDTARTHISFSSGFYDKPKRSELVWWDNANPAFSNASFFHSRQIKNFDLVIGGNGFSDNSYRELEEEQRYRFNLNTRYRFKKVKGLSAGVNGNYVDTHGGYFILWASGDSAYYPQGGSVSDYHSIRATLDPYIIYYTPKGHRHSLRTRYYNSTNKNNTNQESIAEVWYAEEQYQLHLKNNLTITNGLVYSYSEVESDSMYGRHFSNNAGVFSQADKKLGRLILSFGVRGEYYKVDTAQTKSTLVIGKDTVTLPIHAVTRAGLNYRLCPHTYLRTSYGQGYRFPSIAEKYITTTVNGLQIFPNPDIQPETGWSAEIGAQQSFKISKLSGYVDVAAFWQEYKNMMEFTFDYWVPPGTPNPTAPFTMAQYFGAKSINVGRTQIKGAEIVVTGSGKIGKTALTVLGGYTYIKPVDLDYDSATAKGTYNGNILKYRYEHTAKIDIQADYKRWSLGLSMRYNSFMKNIDRSFQDPLLLDLFPTMSPPYLYILPGLKEYREEHNTGDVVWDFRLSYLLSKQVKASVVANNVGNREYMGRPGDVQPPRSFAFMLSVKM